MSAQALGERLSQVISAIHKPKKTTDFKVGDTVKVHARIVEGNKERIQIFEGIVIARKKGTGPSATFTVRKISYNVGVERTFLLHSPRIEKVEIVNRGSVRRAKLFYLRETTGKAGRVKTKLYGVDEAAASEEEATPAESAPASQETENTSAEPAEQASAS